MELEPGQSPPLAVITPQDQRGVLYVGGGLALATTLVCLVVRAYVRLGFGHTIGSDDYTVVASFVLLIFQTVALFIGVSYGLGLSTSLISHSDALTMQRAILAADLLGILVLWLSRCSSVLFYMRLSQDQRHKWIWQAMLAIMAVLALASLLTVGLRCDLAQAWLFIGQHCTGLFQRWIAVTAFDLFFEVLLFVHPLCIIAGLQMPLQVKMKVLCAFGWRLLVVVPLMLRLFAISAFYESTNSKVVSSYDMTRPWIYTQIALAVSIIMPTVPMLQPFVRATATTFGMVSGDATNSYSGPRSKSHGSKDWSQPLSKPTHSSKLRGLNSKSQTERDDDNRDGSPKDHCLYSASVIPGSGRKSSNSGSDISQQPMIRREIEYGVSYSDGRL